MKPATAVRVTWSAECARVLRFGSVGVAATAVYLGASAAGVHLLRLGPVAGSILGQAASTLVSYFGHAYFSFQVKLDHRNYLARFLLIAAVTFGLNAMVIELLVNLLHAPYFAATGFVTVLIPVTNYLCNRYWVFLPGIQESSAGPIAIRSERK